MDTVMTGAVVEMTTKFEARKGRNGWGQFTRRQIKWLGNAATLLASTVGHEFTVEVINTIRQPVTNDDFACALRQLLAEHDSAELADQVFAKNNGVKANETTLRQRR